ncbi:MAG: AbrB/MazE/SpoVT family DNA-binding domain-containing protein [Eubacterium sp.]|nr:AbrB/MazE/SpoVT family DNA-binding domain-containing protein [Eubacterium sp.]
MSGEVVLKTWGNSLGLRIPKKILEESRISPEDSLQMLARDGEIVIRKVFQHKTFQERLDEYCGEITVVDFDWGEPQGKELL